IAEELCRQTGEARSEQRTCVDAGNTLMFALLAPGGRSLRVLSRLADDPEERGICRWLRASYTQQTREQWFTETFIGEHALAWQHTTHFSQTVGGKRALQRLHAALGSRGRIFTLSSPLGCEDASRSWVSWQLD